MKNLILEIQAEFFRRLEEKNSWGKNEVKGLYQSVQVMILSEKLVEKEQRNLRKAVDFAKNYGGEGTVTGRINTGTPNIAHIRQSENVNYIHAAILGDKEAYAKLPETHQKIVDSLLAARGTKEFQNLVADFTGIEKTILKEAGFEINNIRDLAVKIKVYKPGPFTAELSIVNQSLLSEFDTAVMYRFFRVLEGVNEAHLLPFTHAEVAKDIIEGRATIDYITNEVTYKENKPEVASPEASSINLNIVDDGPHFHSQEVIDHITDNSSDNVVSESGDSEGVF